MVVEVKVFPEQITIENFKSIKRVTLKLKPGINLLVGPNRAGKTNILEAIYFLSKALSREELLRIPYAPHLPQYWSPEDIFFMRNIDRSIRFEILFRVVARREEKYFKHYIRMGVAFAITPDRSGVELVQLILDFKTLKLMINKNSINILINKEYLDTCLAMIKEFSGEIPSALLEQTVNKLVELKDHSKEVKEEFLQFYSMPVEEPKIINRFLLDPLHIFYSIHRKHLKHLTDKIISPYLLLLKRRYAPEVAVPFITFYEPSDSSEFKGYSLPKSLSITTLFEEHDIIPVSYYLDDIIRIVEDITLLKHPDVGAISEPQPFGGGERLDVRARNLPQILYKLAAEGKVDTIENLLKDIFGGVSIRLGSVANRVFFVVREGSIELPPPNIADGVVKVLAIATAAELRPSILLINEIENSLHVEAIQKIFDFLNNLEIPVLVATHSPAVIDLIDLDRVVIASRGSDDSTGIEHIENVEAVRKRLLELGVSHSEYILYGKTLR
jgi:energy-coupling factor transporter ATP-binding protein EcfA2